MVRAQSGCAQMGCILVPSQHRHGVWHKLPARWSRHSRWTQVNVTDPEARFGIYRAVRMRNSSRCKCKISMWPSSITCRPPEYPRFFRGVLCRASVWSETLQRRDNQTLHGWQSDTCQCQCDRDGMRGVPGMHCVQQDSRIEAP